MFEDQPLAAAQAVVAGLDVKLIEPEAFMKRHAIYKVVAAGFTRAETIARNRAFLVNLGIDKPLIPSRPDPPSARKAPKRSGVSHSPSKCAGPPIWEPSGISAGILLRIAAFLLFSLISKTQAEIS